MSGLICASARPLWLIAHILMRCAWLSFVCLVQCICCKFTVLCQVQSSVQHCHHSCCLLQAANNEACKYVSLVVEEGLKMPSTSSKFAAMSICSQCRGREEAEEPVSIPPLCSDSPLWLECSAICSKFRLWVCRYTVHAHQHNMYECGVFTLMMLGQATVGSH